MMIRRMGISARKLVAAMVVGLLLSTIAPSALYAAEPREEITMSPAVTKLSGEVGQSKKGSFKVVNTGEVAFDYTVYARPYSVDTEAYNPNYSDTPERSNLYRWVQFDKTTGSLQPGQTDEINYSVLVPQSASPGGHYGVLFAETVPAKSQKGVVVRTKRVGSVVRITVKGDVKRAGKISSIDVPWLQLKTPLEANARIENSGNVDFDASSTTLVETIFGREVFKSDNSHVVFPGKPRTISTEWDGASGIGLYKVSYSVSAVDDQQSATSYVLMLPRTLLLVMASLILAGGMYAAYRRRR